MDALKFNLRRNVIPVVIEDEGGVQHNYELREMNASTRDKYLDALGARIIVDKNGEPTGIRKFEGMQAELLSVCLYREGNDKPVTREDIQKWPSGAVSELFKAAQGLNHLSGEEKAAETKND